LPCGYDNKRVRFRVRVRVNVRVRVKVRLRVRIKVRVRDAFEAMMEKGQDQIQMTGS
jgi:hypothetical protein